MTFQLAQGPSYPVTNEFFYIGQRLRAVKKKEARDALLFATSDFAFPHFVISPNCDDNALPRNPRVTTGNSLNNGWQNAFTRHLDLIGNAKSNVFEQLFRV